MPNTYGSRLYPRRASMLPDETLTVCVSCATAQFQLELWRVGADDRLVYTSDWYDGSSVTALRADVDFTYPAYEVSPPEPLAPGVYIARLFEGEDGARLAAQSQAVRSGKAEALFVVRRPADEARGMLYKLPLATYQAYNFTGGGSLYHVAHTSHGHASYDDHQRIQDAQGRWLRARRVTLQRPGGGLGGDTWPGERDPYELASARNTFEHWDGPFLRWLARNELEHDVCVDLDIHQNPELLSPYSLVVSAGHDEYWSEAARMRLEDFVARGGNLAIFGGNTCWWRVQYVEDDTAMLCDKDDHHTPDQWYRTRPEEALIGLSYRYGGSWWQSRRNALGYTVQHADHWLYAQTGLSEGDVLGAATSPPLIGYECDGVPFRRDSHGLAVPHADAGCATPAGFQILGLAELGHEWPVRNGRAATMGIYTAHDGGGTVFNAGTVDWAMLLEQDEAVAQITRNVLQRLGV
jgi:hypothetical protein